jgi:fructoselysine and glucoselysine-specific PTS system IIB component
MKGMDDSISALNSGVTDKYSLFILVDSVEDAYRLTEGVPSIKSINLGGMKNSPERKQISKAVHVSENDISLIKEMSGRGIKFEIRLVPNDAEENPLSLI